MDNVCIIWGRCSASWSHVEPGHAWHFKYSTDPNSGDLNTTNITICAVSKQELQFSFAVGCLFASSDRTQWWQPPDWGHKDPWAAERILWEWFNFWKALFKCIWQGLSPAFGSTEAWTNVLLAWQGGQSIWRWQGTGCVAVVRLGNEWGVNRCKMPWFIKRGCTDQPRDIGLLWNRWEAFLSMSTLCMITFSKANNWCGTHIKTLFVYIIISDIMHCFSLLV